MAALRTQYQEHIASMFHLAGLDDPSARAARVFGLETKMANVHATRSESENVHAPETWKTADLAAEAPGIDWQAFLDAAGLKAAPFVVAWQPKSVAGLAALVASEPLESWKDWLVFHALESSAEILPKAFAEEQFHFSGTVLSGIQQQKPRTLRAIDATNRALGEAMGELYVQKYFSPQTKAEIQALVANLEQAFGRRIDALSWMSPETKANAKRKLSTLRVGIGYPDRWSDLSGLRIVRDDAFGNAARVSLFRYQTQIAKLAKKVDPDEWWTTPQTVNAFNLPLQNGLNFPAAMLQPPYFEPGGDAARNYGSEGSVIGHEISHSFDDQGSQFDAQGRLANWFTKADLEHLRAACESLATQFDQYQPFPDVAVNGHQTLSENVADLAGLLAAYDAYHVSLQGKTDIVKDGLTGDQRFFLGYAQVWRANTREATLRKNLATGGHAPEMFRVDEVRNVDAWYAAFNVLPAQKLYLAPADRVRIW
jgi:predicted metalloendopeptidase